MNSDWWAQAHGTAAGASWSGLDSDDTVRTHTIWTLTYKSHTAVR